MRWKQITLVFALTLLIVSSYASRIIIPMGNDNQKNHLKAYGIAYWVLQQKVKVDWLLNYNGGSFAFKYNESFEKECKIRGVSYKVVADVQYNNILQSINNPERNQDLMKLEKAPKIAIYAPQHYQPWDDAVMLVLTYAEIPYEVVYDDAVLAGKLPKYDWLHLHHEDFTGQFGKFWAHYRNHKWYKEEVQRQRQRAKKHGFNKVSQLKLAVAKKIKKYVAGGGFLFSMCSGTDTYDIALAAQNTDICRRMFDGDPPDPNAQKKLDYSKTLAFEDFKLVMNPYRYEYSNIDATDTRGKIPKSMDYFTLFEFSAKWDPVPTMLTQCHTRTIQGFMGQTTAFRKPVIKSSVVIMGENKSANEARYIYGEHGNGFFAFYGGHDPEDYKHMVGDPKTNLDLHTNSPSYRLILNNVLFPAARKKKKKT